MPPMIFRWWNFSNCFSVSTEICVSVVHTNLPEHSQWGCLFYKHARGQLRLLFMYMWKDINSVKLTQEVRKIYLV